MNSPVMSHRMAVVIAVAIAAVLALAIVTAVASCSEAIAAVASSIPITR